MKLKTKKKKEKKNASQNTNNKLVKELNDELVRWLGG